MAPIDTTLPLLAWALADVVAPSPHSEAATNIVPGASAVAVCCGIAGVVALPPRVLSVSAKAVRITPTPGGGGGGRGDNTLQCKVCPSSCTLGM